MLLSNISINNNKLLLKIMNLKTSGKLNLNSNKSSPDSSSSYVSITNNKVRAIACRSAPIRLITGPQLCITGSSVTRYTRKLNNSTDNDTTNSSCDEGIVHNIKWKQKTSTIDTTKEMNNFLIKHSACTVANRIQISNKRISLKSAPLLSNKNRKKILVSRTSSSSSAKDAISSSDIDNNRPRGPSPPSSISTVSPICSIPIDHEENKKSSCDDEERFSFPVSPLQLQHALTVASSIKQENRAIDPFSLADMQEKIIELVEAQQLSTQITWNTMKQISAKLEELFPNSSGNKINFSTTYTPPSPLLLEAAGCATRLAQILKRLGETSVQYNNTNDNLENTITPEVIPPAPPSIFPANSIPIFKTKLVAPTSTELIEQKSKLRHVVIEQKSKNRNRNNNNTLRDILIKRRESIESVSSSCITSPTRSWVD